MKAQDFAQSADSVPQPYLDYPSFPGELFDLEAILVPPEVEEDGTEGKKGEWSQCYVRIFDDDVSLPPSWYHHVFDCFKDNPRPDNTGWVHFAV